MQHWLEESGVGMKNDEWREFCAVVAPKDSKPRNILLEANEIAGENRQRDYGHPLTNHERIAAMWNIQLGPKLSKPIEPREVALMMIALKLAREVNTPLRDNALDIAGYVRCIDMIDEKQVR